MTIKNDKISVVLLWLNFWVNMWCMWFLSEENGCLFLINLIKNNLINSNPGNIIKINILSADKETYPVSFAVVIIKYEIKNPNE